MKRVAILLFFAALVVSCSKKTELAEPEYFDVYRQQVAIIKGNNINIFNTVIKVSDNYIHAIIYDDLSTVSFEIITNGMKSTYRAVSAFIPEFIVKNIEKDLIRIYFAGEKPYKSEHLITQGIISRKVKTVLEEGKLVAEITYSGKETIYKNIEAGYTIKIYSDKALDESI